MNKKTKVLLLTIGIIIVIIGLIIGFALLVDKYPTITGLTVVLLLIVGGLYTIGAAIYEELNDNIL